VLLRIARFQERNGDGSTEWSIFQGTFDPGAPRSWLLRRLRRSVFRPCPPKPGFGPFTVQSRTVVPHHERESCMAGRKLTVDRHEEIKRRLADGRSVREIATALGCSRRLVRQIRDGERLTHQTAASPEPLWMSQLEWPVIIHELGLGHPMKFIWEERAKALITYPNFWKQFYRKFPQYREATITAREFSPGERVEVDYAGDPIEWYEIKTGEIHKAYVFVSGLGFSQLLFAWASEDMKSRNWLGCHRRMYEWYGGVPHVTVPDCLKTGVVKCHLYDPDLNEDYAYLAAHFSTAIVPARVRKPKDKAIAEGLVKILSRYFRFRFRRSRFTSIAEINQALMVCVERINDQTHRRFGVSRPAWNTTAGNGRRRSCTPTATSPSMAITTAHRISTAAKVYESSSPSIMLRSS
jgi:transposase